MLISILKKPIPSIVTFISLISGLIGMYYGLAFANSIKTTALICGNMYIFSLCLCAGIIFDGVDGSVARYFQVESHFGATLDSLADFFNFGIAPAIVLYCNYIMSYNSALYIVSVFYILCIFFRLARFTAHKITVSHKASDYTKYFFTGVPSPIAASLLLTPMHLDMLGLITVRSKYYLILFLASYIIAGVMAISTLPTLAIGRLPLPKNTLVRVFVLIFMMLYILLLILNPHVVLLISNGLYVLCLPFTYVYFKKISMKSNIIG